MYMVEIRISLLGDEWSIYKLFYFHSSFGGPRHKFPFNSQHYVTIQNYYSIMHEFLWLQTNHYNFVNVRVMVINSINQIQQIKGYVFL